MKRRTAAGAAAWTRASALRSWAFWSVSAPFALAITSQAGFLVHQIAFLEPTIGRNPAGIAVAVTTGMAIVGRLVLGTMANWLDQRLASALSLASQAAALGVMTRTGDADTLLAACAVYGFSVGNVITFPALIVQREFEAGRVRHADRAVDGDRPVHLRLRARLARRRARRHRRLHAPRWRCASRSI